MKHASIILLTNNMKAHYILIAALCGLTGCREDNGAADAADRREMPPLKVSVMNMEQRTVELKSSWFGHLRGVEQADIRPQVSGTLIRQVYWDGSICDKGELLFEIDPATYQAAVDREAANLATARAVKLQAEASLDRVQKDLDRYDKLIRTGAISVKNLTDAQQNLKEMQAALEQAEAGIKQAEASLENARINLDRTKVRAPFRGLASKATASVGELISASGSPLTTMSSIDPIRVDGFRGQRGEPFDGHRQFRRPYSQSGFETAFRNGGARARRDGYGEGCLAGSRPRPAFFHEPPQHHGGGSGRDAAPH